MALSKAELQTIRERAEKAHEMVSALCKPRSLGRFAGVDYVYSGAARSRPRLGNRSVEPTMYRH